MKRRDVLGEIPNDIMHQSKTPLWAAGQRKPDFASVGFTAGTTSIQLLPVNHKRTYLLIQNKSGSDMYVSFGRDADTYNGVLVVAGGAYEPYIAPSSSVHVIGGAASLNGITIEGISTQDL